MSVLLDGYVVAVTSKLDDMKIYIMHIVHTRLHTNTTVPMHECHVTRSWVARHSMEHIHDAFRSIRSWLPDNWESQVDRSVQRKTKSVALF